MTSSLQFKMLIFTAVWGLLETVDFSCLLLEDEDERHDAEESFHIFPFALAIAEHYSAITYLLLTWIIVTDISKLTKTKYTWLKKDSSEKFKVAGSFLVGIAITFWNITPYWAKKSMCSNARDSIFDYWGSPSLFVH